MVSASLAVCQREAAHSLLLFMQSSAGVNTSRQPGGFCTAIVGASECDGIVLTVIRGEEGAGALKGKKDGWPNPAE